MLPLNLDMGDVHLAVVCGFPSGKHTSAVKAAELVRPSPQGPRRSTW
ncbi:deoxyribose-phosphate aldolase [Cutibacterium acnes JCM 18916]|nr:deoxyribose-phosphate aldolase [Cutibacterium acnes JCM 18916]